MEQSQVSSHQLRFIIISSITVTGHLLKVPIIFGIAGRDAWLTLIIGVGYGIVIALILTQLGRKVPGRSLIEIFNCTMGKTVGKTIGLLYIGFFILVASITLGAMMDFMTSRFMPDTPPLVFGVTFLFVCIYAVYSGLENFLRANEILLPFLIIAGIIISIMVLPDKNFKNLLPIMEDGIMPVLKGSIHIITLMSEMIVFAMIQPALNDLKTLKKTNIMAVLIIGMMFIGPLTGPIALFGEESAAVRIYPTYEEIKHVQIKFLGNLSPFGVLLWLAGSFGKISIFLYGATLTCAQVTGTENYRKWILPIGAAIFLITVFMFPDVIKIRVFLMGIYKYVCIGLGFVLPVVLISVLEVKRYLSST